jgi:hypothetical protein
VGVESSDDDAATAAGDACELRDRGGRVGDELEHGHGEREIERVVLERDVLDGGSGAAAGRLDAGQAEHVGIGVDADHRGVPVGEGRAEAAGAAAGVEDTSAGEIAGSAKDRRDFHREGVATPGLVEPGVVVAGIAGPAGRVTGLGHGRGRGRHRRAAAGSRAGGWA